MNEEIRREIALKLCNEIRVENKRGNGFLSGELVASSAISLLGEMWESCAYPLSEVAPK